MLNLYLLRHAKSSWAELFARDFDRPLSGRGRRGAKAIAGHMAERGLIPRLVLCSPARRTRETLDALSEEQLKGAQILFEDALYGGGAGDYLALVKEHGGAADPVLLIAHNPAIEDLARLLIAGGDEAARAEMEEKFPTAALAHIAFNIADWSEVALNSGRLVSFTKPRDL